MMFCLALLYFAFNQKNLLLFSIMLADGTKNLCEATCVARYPCKNNDNAVVCHFERKF